MNALRRLIHSVFGRSKANADGRCPTTTVPDADSVSMQFASKLPDVRRLRNLAKLEARAEAARERHRQLMATRPGARS
jgi:hypothetical protein